MLVSEQLSDSVDVDQQRVHLQCHVVPLPTCASVNFESVKVLVCNVSNACQVLYTFQHEVATWLQTCHTFLEWPPAGLAKNVSGLPYWVVTSTIVQSKEC